MCVSKASKSGTAVNFDKKAAGFGVADDASFNQGETMESLEELQTLTCEELYEKIDHAKRMHYQFLCDLNLSNVSQDERKEAFSMSQKIKEIDYVFGQKLCDQQLIKAKNWAL